MGRQLYGFSLTLRMTVPQIKESVRKKYPYLKGKTEYVVKNEEFYYHEGINYSASGSKGPSFRHLPEGCIFDVGGSSIFSLGKYKNLFFILAFYNSKLTKLHYWDA